MMRSRTPVRVSAEGDATDKPRCKEMNGHKKHKKRKRGQIDRTGRSRHPAGMLLDDLEVRPLLTVAQLDALHRRHRGDRNYPRTVAEAVASGSAVLERAGAWLLRREAAARGGYPAED